MNSPISWFGGKGLLKKWVLHHLEKYHHKSYVEPFGGGASVLFAKQPVKHEVYNDLDERLINFFKVLADPESFEQFKRRVEALPYSRKLFYEYREAIETETDSVKRAAMFFVLAKQSFAGRIGRSPSWGFAVSNNGKSQTSQWMFSIRNMPQVHQRLLRVQIECMQAIKLIDYYDTTETLFYCDPPYVHSTRGNVEYLHEMTNDDHVELVNKLLNIKGMCVISCYDHHIYQPLLNDGWTKVTKEVVCHAAGRTRTSGLKGNGNVSKHQKRTETMYISPKCKQKNMLF